MITLLLPFLLLSRISMDLESLLHGPEYTYRIQVSTTKGDDDSGMKRKVFDVGSTLKCRPRVSDTLSCRFEAVEMTVSGGGLLDPAQVFVEDSWVDEEPFEIKFQRNGSSQLIVTHSMKPYNIDTIPAIVKQLNVAVDLRNEEDGQDKRFERLHDRR